MQSFLLIAFVSFLAKVVAECPNSCSGHGSCGQYDMCSCYRNWMASDCSQRVCQFNNAHVDIPLGDLDMSSGALSGPDVSVTVNSVLYPYGTTEQFPAMVDTESNTLTDSAHAYTECSSKGICDRTSGTCDCFTGYSGSACQRASCPSTAAGMCSGHGVCKSISQIAFDDYNNTYDLWDKHATMGCVCDGGFSGPDCSEKKCKWGVDPLYKNDGRNPSVPNYTFEFYTSDDTSNSKIEGNYSIVFTDIIGETWKTTALDISSTCDQIQSALYSIPNDVINGGVWCYRSTFTRGANPGNIATPVATYDGQEPDTSQNPVANTARLVYEKFTLVFKNNPGLVPQPSIDIYLDGNRPTLFATASNDLKISVYKNGFSGENIDYVPDRCDGVRVTIDDSSTTEEYVKLIPGDIAMTKLLKKCLGDSNGVISDNIEVYNWDYGTVSHPHVIKLLDLSQWSLNGYDTSSWSTFQAASATNPDREDYNEPVTRICDDPEPNNALYGVGLCSNKNPASFYVMMYYNLLSDEFRVFHDAGRDYDMNTPFAVYTTTNTFKLTNPNSIAFTTVKATPTYPLGRDFSSYLHFINASVPDATGTIGILSADFTGEVSCEHSGTNGALTNGALACLDKEDKILVMKMPAYDVAQPNEASANHNQRSSFMCNPVYPNLYTVKKMWRAELTLNSYEGETGSYASYRDEPKRNRMLLDSGVNGDWYYEREPGQSVSNTANVIGETAGCAAYVYKLILNTTTYPDGGYKYAQECSGRGICDSMDGTCNCFAGYTNDNCDTQNSLVQ